MIDDLVRAVRCGDWNYVFGETVMIVFGVLAAPTLLVASYFWH